MWRPVMSAVVVALVELRTYLAAAVPVRLKPVAVTVFPSAADLLANVAVPPVTLTSSATVSALVNPRSKIVAELLPSYVLLDAVIVGVSVRSSV
jgi:hypothetical protein